MAEEEDQDQKTEDPTQKRLEESREEGQLPISREVGTWFMFVGMIVTLAVMGPMLGGSMARTLRVFFEKPHQLRVEDQGVQRVLGQVLLDLGFPMALIFLLLLVLALAGTMIQTGFFIAPNILKFDLMRLSPLEGLKRIFSKTSLVEFAKGLVKVGALAYVAWGVIKPIVAAIETYEGHDMMFIAEAIRSQSIRLILVMMVMMTLIAAVDYFYQRYTWYQKLRMSKTEVRDEHKQSEGDPMIKARLRQIRMEKSRKRMMAQVPNADVIITNPTHFAIALKYDPGKMNAPTVLAKGADLIAQRIRELAAEHDIPLVSNPPLARTLYQTVDIDEEIPAQHYRAVAEIISYVYKLKKKAF